jgi:hypothetical protein
LDHPFGLAVHPSQISAETGTEQLALSTISFVGAAGQFRRNWRTTLSGSIDRLLVFEDVADALLLDNGRLNGFGRSKSPGSLKSIKFHEPSGKNQERREEERNHDDAPAPGIAKSVKASQTLSASVWIKPQNVGR